MGIFETEQSFLVFLCILLLTNGVLAFCILHIFSVEAPYGRYSTFLEKRRKENPEQNENEKTRVSTATSQTKETKIIGWGPLINAKLAWVWMESPNLYIGAYCIFLAWQEQLQMLLQYEKDGNGKEIVVTSNNKPLTSVFNQILLCCFFGHYINRSLIYPLRMRGGKPMPLSVMLMAQLFCTLNGYIQTRTLSSYLELDIVLSTSNTNTTTDSLTERLYSLQPLLPSSLYNKGVFSVGVFIFLIGAYINNDADHILRNLRKPGETEYKIPYGGMFNYVSGANFFGEILEWFGFALATGFALPSLTFASFTALNIGPRAIQHHKWYLQKFREDYPKKRKALIPFVY